MPHQTQAGQAYAAQAHLHPVLRLKFKAQHGELHEVHINSTWSRFAQEHGQSRTSREAMLIACESFIEAIGGELIEAHAVTTFGYEIGGAENV